MVTVIVTAFNEEKCIGRCLESLVSQDYDCMEILVIDDGSTDGTSDIVKRYVQAYPDKIRLIKLPRNFGPGNARNIGALNARGEVIVFLDADMVFPKSFIRELVSPILNGECIATCYEYEVIANTTNPWVKVQGQAIRGFAGADFTWAIRAIRRSIFISLGGYDAKYGYFDDTSLHERTGIASCVVKGLYVYHYNPSDIKEIFRKSFWIGLSLRPRYSRNKRELIKLLAKRLFDFSPIIGLFLTLLGSFFVLIGSSLVFSFMIVVFRSKILPATSLRESLVLRLLYAPAYRLIKSSGTLIGFLSSLIKKWTTISLNLNPGIIW